MNPHDLKYSKEHEWIRIDGDMAVVGITDHAQSELGDITFVELPSVGDSLHQGGTAATLESVKAASDVYAPVSGEVTEVNGSLQDAPETINRAPLDEGWIFKMKPSDMTEIEGLMSFESYQEYLATI